MRTGAWQRATKKVLLTDSADCSSISEDQDKATFFQSFIVELDCMQWHIFYWVLGIYGHILASMLAMPPPRPKSIKFSSWHWLFCSLQFSVESNNLPIRFSLQKHTHGALSNSLWCKWIWDVSSSILLAKWLITLEQSKEHGAKGWYLDWELIMGLFWA